MKAIVLAVSLSLTVVSAAASAQPLPSELTTLGVTAGMPYAKAKRLLDAAGWQAKPAQNASEALDGFPEVGCQRGGGNCEATFAREGQQLAVRVATTQAGQPFVQGDS